MYKGTEMVPQVTHMYYAIIFKDIFNLAKLTDKICKKRLVLDFGSFKLIAKPLLFKGSNGASSFSCEIHELSFKHKPKGIIALYKPLKK